MPVLVSVAAELIREIAAQMEDPSPMDPEALDLALSRLRNALPDAPQENRAALFGAIGVLCGRLHKFDEAVEAHRAAAALDKSNFHHLLNAAGCLIQLGRFAEAADALRGARACPGNPPGARFRISLVDSLYHEHLGERDEARTAFEDAMAHMDPTQPGELKVLMEAYPKLFNGEVGLEVISFEELRRRLDEAPIDDEPLTPEEEELVAEAVANPHTLTTEEVLRELGLAP